MGSPGIDTTSLLTILGVIAAVWALVPPTSRLSFRLSLSWFDWIVVLSILLTVHALIFEDVLRALRMYPVLGPWKWGFDKNGLLYLLFLGLTLYVWWRSRKTRLHPANVALFERLAMALLHARKYEDLGALLEQHLPAALEIADSRGWRGHIISVVRPPSPPFPKLELVGGQLLARAAPPKPCLVAMQHKVRAWLVDELTPKDSASLRAASLIKLLLSSRQLVGYLALAHPHLCLAVMTQATRLVDDFQDNFFDSLLRNESSIFYSELKNSHNLDVGRRLRILPENRLISFYLKDVQVAASLGVYRSLGESMLSMIDTDDELSQSLNGPMRTYGDVEAYRCPIYCGVHFFRIMVLEGLHQQTSDHLWLHYVPHFVDHILARARPLTPDDENFEFATRFSYLLYQLVKVTTDWIEQAERVTEAGDVLTHETVDGRHAFIAFEACGALGPVMQDILQSEKVTDRLKDELFEAILRTLGRIEAVPRLVPLANAMASSLVRPHGFKASDGYVQELSSRYSAMDYHLRKADSRLKRSIDAELAE
jgi:hypothetical protein